MSRIYASKAPRIIFHHLRGLTVREVAQRVGCCETWAQQVISLFKAEGRDLAA